MILKQIFYWYLFWSTWLGWLFVPVILSNNPQGSSKPITIFMLLLGLASILSTILKVYTSRLLKPNIRMNVLAGLWFLFGIFLAPATAMIPMFFCNLPQFGQCGYVGFAWMMLIPVILVYILVGAALGDRIHQYIFSRCN